MLARLLQKLEDQQTEARFSYSIVVVDNDPFESAKTIVESFKIKTALSIRYIVQPEQNLALVRNTAFANSTGDYLALIDDDEYPVEDWLLKHFDAITKYLTTGILGPVKPDFEIKPPDWIVKSKICERPSFVTGTFFENARQTRTGNVLLDMAKLNFLERSGPFDLRFKSGGEDVDFFERMMAQGHRFAWCEEASVYETVPAERLTRAYYLKRALLRGGINANRSSLFCFGTVKSIIAVVLYTLLLPVLFVFRHHIFMDILIKDCDHLGKLLAYCGINLVKERSF